MRKSELVTLHFDLSHCPQNVPFTLLTGDGKRHPLTAYSDAPGKMEEHRRQNKALGLIPEPQVHRITHFIEDAPLDAEHLSMRRVEYPSLDGHPLPELALVFFHIPAQHRRRSARPCGAMLKKAVHPMALTYYGVSADAVDDADSEDIHLAADSIKPPYETAKSIIFNHPEIGTVNPAVAKYVFDNHVNHTQDFQDLVEYIQNHPPESGQTWYQKTYATWINPDTGKEEPIPANEDLVYKDGQKASWPTLEGTPVIPLYDLTDSYNSTDGGVVAAAAPAVQKILIATKNDETLNGQLWTKQAGQTQKSETHVAPAPSPGPVNAKAAPQAAGATAADTAKGFAIKNTTSSYGLYLYDDELTYDYGAKTLSFPVKNWPNRYLGAYVQFFKADGTAIKRQDIPGWVDSLPDFLQGALEPSATKNYLDWISSGNMIFGIPTPFLTNKADLSFLWPQEATRAEVLLGGLGVACGFKDWDTDVDIVGVLGTGVVCYGVSALSMVLTVYIVNPLVWGLKGDAKIAFYIVCGLVGVNAIILGGLGYKTSMGKYILSKLATMAVSIIFGIAVQKILQAVYKEALLVIIGEAVAEITTEEALGEIPVAGWALKIASVSADIAAMTATTIECLASPATYKLEVLHTMDLNVTVTPDPAHGKPGVNPVWPLVSDHYVIQVKYPQGNGQDGGTTYTKAGPMPGQHDQPIAVTFSQIPAGGKIEVVASIYSDTDWLAGIWDSGWQNADPDKDDKLNISGAIKENLVPLTADTIYSQKQFLAYSEEQKHFWEVTIFTISDTLAADLDRGIVSDALRQAFKDNGNTLSANVTVTVTAAGNSWTLTDVDRATVYTIVKRQIYAEDGQTLYELAVQDTTHAAPGIPDVIYDCGPDGHRLCDRVNLTINNKEYQLGYAWRASGQNLPRDYGTAPDNGQMYTFQSISTLGSPQASIIEPERGFSNAACLAFDQFGLTALFDLAQTPYAAELNKGGPVPADIAAEFAKFSLPLPEGTIVTVLTVDQAWDLGLAGQDPLYSLRLTQVIKDGVWQTVINVYSYPVPRLDNFYLDSRTYTPDNPLYYLRGVSFATGRTTFDYDTKKSWGCFQNVTITALAVHPQGYIVGADYDNHKLLTLRLPPEAVDDKDAPIAMPLSGEGLREGLMNKPVALTVTADGRILILEEGNRRIQAFDVKGNAVPCFSVGQTPFAIDAAFAATLDSRTVTTALIQAFQMNVTPAVASLFTSDSSSVAALNNGQVDDTLKAAFVNYGYGQATDTFTAVVTQADMLWLVTDTTTGAVYDVRALADHYGITSLYAFNAFALAINVKAAGLEWIIDDTANAMTFDVSKQDKEANLKVQRLVSVMPLRDEGAADITYLDLAAELKGYIYCLSQCTQGDTKVFRLDIYNPDGTVLLTQPQTGVNAEKMTVDQWRSLFTMNLEKFLGPGGRTEPGISEWEPSTPAAPTSNS